MKKKFVFMLLLVAAMLLGLCSCGNNVDTGEASDIGSSESLTTGLSETE